MTEVLDAALAAIQEDLGGAQPPPLTPHDLSVLAGAAPDGGTLKRWLKRRMAGEPLAYIAGGFTFDGQWFAVDRRAYVTDPELIHLVDALSPAIQSMVTHDHVPLVAEFGVGCGSLMLSLKRRVPQAEFVGIDIDPGALAVATNNARRLGLDVKLLVSDLFEAWPAALEAPDVICGDPPWGDAETLYGEGIERPAGHYDAMPAASAFPLGGRVGLHAQIIRAAGRMGWSSEIWLNCGVLLEADVVSLAALTSRWELVRPAPQISILRCVACPT